MQALDAATLEELLARLERLRPDAPAKWGKMNAHQMLCHLNDSFGLAMGEKSASPAITVLHRTVLRWIALHTNLSWPQGVPTRPEMDQYISGTKPIAFDQDKARLAATMRRFAATPRDFAFSRHPGFGELTEWEWMRWGYLHAAHHFRQFGI